MEFRAGDDVIHPSYGLGSIMRVEERQLAETEMRRYYVLAIGAMTVWVPMRADGSTILRAVTARQDLEQYRALLKSRPTILDRDYRKRQLDFNERLTHGSFQVMCEIVRDLTALGRVRSIGESDAAILKKVRDNLWREWAAATGRPVPEAAREVNALLRAGQVADKA